MKDEKETKSRPLTSNTITIQISKEHWIRYCYSITATKQCPFFNILEFLRVQQQAVVIGQGDDTGAFRRCRLRFSFEMRENKWNTPVELCSLFVSFWCSTTFLLLGNPHAEKIVGERKRRPPVNNFLFTKRTKDLTCTNCSSVHWYITAHAQYGRKKEGNNGKRPENVQPLPKSHQ